MENNLEDILLSLLAIINDLQKRMNELTLLLESSDKTIQYFKGKAEEGQNK